MWVAVAVVAVGSLCGWLISTTQVSARTDAHRVHPPRHVATVTKPRAPTTTLPDSSEAAATLVRDVQSAIATGALTSNVGTAVLDQLGQALAASDSGNPSGAGSALGAMEALIADGESEGKVGSSEAAHLDSDVSALATALGVAPVDTAAAQPPSTQPPSTQPPAASPPATQPPPGHSAPAAPPSQLPGAAPGKGPGHGPGGGGKHSDD